MDPTERQSGASRTALIGGSALLVGWTSDYVPSWTGSAPAAARGPTTPASRSAIRALARHRGTDSSICPSDAARAVGGENWRDLMVDADEVARELAKGGGVEITQRGRVLDPGDDWRGPIRIRTTDDSPRV